jgi:hypothetical protein
MEHTSHRFRQVHLDFHTALEVESIGDQFDPKQFVETLRAGKVDTINIFARCHHGYSYYPTQVGTMHPKLNFDLLGTMIEALHSADIRCPIYSTVKWDDLSGINHPEWMCVRKDGSLNMRPVLTGQWGWSTMDLSTGYSDYFVALLEEMIARYGNEIDGYWFDICFPAPNYSPWSMAKMRKAGVNLEDDAAVWAYSRQQDLAFFERVTNICKQKTPRASLYYNGTTTPDMGEAIPFMTHLEVESLPTSGDTWGYLHYPITARMARSYGKEVIGMTGRFHRSWADFGGLKTQDQLDYECGTILAAGGKICVGDQLHPRGVLDPAVYRLIGKSFGRVEALEPWLIGAQPTSEVALLAVGKPADAAPGVSALHPDVEGAAQLLLEERIQFDITDANIALDRYPVAFLPDCGKLSPAWVAKLEAYLAQGGKLVVSGTGAFDPETGKFQLKEIPVDYLGLAPTRPSYIRPDETMQGGSELASDYDYVFYDQAHLVKPVLGSICFGEIKAALFNRTWEHFTSHQHAPVGDSLHSPAAVKKGSVLYLAAPLFSAYRTWDFWAYRAMVVKLLRGFMPPSLLTMEAPGWVEGALHNQQASKDAPERKIVHLVAYHPRRSSQAIQHVDQSWKTSGLSVSVRWEGQPPARVYLAPEMQDLSFTQDNDVIRVAIPPINSHAVLVLEKA